MNGRGDCDSCTRLPSLLRGEQTPFHSLCGIDAARVNSGKDVLLLSVGVEHLRRFMT